MPTMEEHTAMSLGEPTEGSPFVATISETIEETAIRAAVEHLFEEAYAAVDEEYLGIMRLNRQGWVPIDVVQARLHHSVVVPAEQIVAAAERSPFLVYNSADRTIRRKTPMRKISLNNTLNRSVLLDHLPADVPDVALFKQLLEALAPWGPVQLVRLIENEESGTDVIRSLLRSLRPGSGPSRCALVVFPSAEHAASFHSILNDKAVVTSWEPDKVPQAKNSATAHADPHRSSPDEIGEPEHSAKADGTRRPSLHLKASVYDDLSRLDALTKCPSAGLSASLSYPSNHSSAALQASIDALRSMHLCCMYAPWVGDSNGRGGRTESNISAGSFARSARASTGRAEDEFQTGKRSAGRERADSGGVASYSAFRKRSGAGSEMEKEVDDARWSHVRRNPGAGVPPSASPSGPESGSAQGSPSLMKTPPRMPRTQVGSARRDRAATDPVFDSPAFYSPPSDEPTGTGRPRWSVLGRGRSGTSGSDVVCATDASPGTDGPAEGIKVSIAKGPSPDGHGFTRRRTSFGPRIQSVAPI